VWEVSWLGVLRIQGHRAAGMRLARTTRGTSAPPNLTSASIRLTYATITSSSALRPRRRAAAAAAANNLANASSSTTTTRQAPPDRERLGSPFAFHPPPRRREGTPSTVTSLAESLHHAAAPPVVNARPAAAGGGCAAYWLRSSRESEWEFQINSLRTTADLRRLIEMGVRQDNQWLVQRCHCILGQCLMVFLHGGGRGRGAEDEAWVQGMDLGGLVQYAESVGFWNGMVLPGVVENGRGGGGGRPPPPVEDQVLILGMVDRYATPPAQIMHQPYR